MRDNIIVKYIIIILSVIVTSFYFFTFKFTYFGGANTKTVLAGFALLLLVIEMAKGRKLGVSKDIVIFTAYSLCISLVCLLAVVYNGTQDYTYATYFISMWVWMAAAYAVLLILKNLNGKLTFDTLSNYLILVCVFQCLMAILISRYPAVRNFVGVIMPELPGLERYADGRLFGVGCAFDVAGIRFSCVLVLIGRMIYKQFESCNANKVLVAMYWLSFFAITIVGNMIARTTTIGVIISLVYMTIISVRADRGIRWPLLRSFLFVMLVCIPISVYLYQSDETFREDFRFGFEGFVSLIETGTWKVDSNDILATMYRFPETLKTWIIGDGYIESANSDPYYLGEYYMGYYKGTDVGYLRFIYYAGLPFLASFLVFFIYVTKSCAQKYEKDRLMFVFILLVQLAVWFKVATDVFMFFALYVAFGKLEYADEVSKDASLTVECHD